MVRIRRWWKRIQYEVLRCRSKFPQAWVAFKQVYRGRSYAYRIFILGEVQAHQNHSMFVDCVCIPSPDGSIHDGFVVTGNNSFIIGCSAIGCKGYGFNGARTIHENS